jgi:hypothetical protein
LGDHDWIAYVFAGLERVGQYSSKREAAEALAKLGRYGAEDH